ncbi:isoprenylcysteine carboxylmethyltransferase family protein [Citreicella sp. C3M06]|uniref:methyltransferase family protein n=1 Tax=Roseobacteraceae TaxID=2854170 RepID=UPI001C09C1DD|nr:MULTISPECIES: isoprenylcysteine carboxylmethyltransferase family protein [Roseobacteraceae]MBU2962919.1 isoprenylcysteine carboxylmethyltransferase family protein [Citreicella sp. C3M06]MDO6586562.1 isoprenylcysteine carboxylmethyltransferase family protein [Salipiger sp. 1_MG-2023]
MPRKWIDIPPLWLAAFLLLAWWQARHHPLGLSFGPVWADLLGGVMLGAGLLVMALAITEMRRNRTTIMPHGEATQLVTSGIFSRSRNPIYLADSLILTGLVLYWDAVPSLALVPIFVWVIEKRFIEKEEMFLRRKFVARYERYLQQTRRWL